MKIKKAVFIVVLLFWISPVRIFSQELFINSEVASSEAKNRKIISLFLNGNKDIFNYTSYVGLMYGITGKFTTMNRIYFSNKAGEQIGDIDLGTNYRFFSNDKKKFHLRMSAFGHLRIPMKPKNTTDINGFAGSLSEDQYRQENFSVYGGYVLTVLNNKFATNLDISYHCNIPKGDYKYGNCIKGGISFGYLVLPRQYKSYKDVNLNLYLETKGYYYAANKINGNTLENSGGKKLEIMLESQVIFFSSLILEAGYVRSFADKNLNIEKDIFFTSIKYLFF